MVLMSQSLNLKILGLYTHPNIISEAPKGALIVADNVIIERESIVSTRRGFKQYNDPIVSPTPVEKLLEYNGTLLSHYNDKLAYDNGTGWTEYTNTYSAPDAEHKITGIQANKNFYFSTSTGVKKIDDVTFEPQAAGAPRALGGTGLAIGLTGWMTDNTAVAYRVVWGYTDVNKNLIIGTPSQRLVVTNTLGNTADVSLTYSIPDDVDENWLYFIYRSSESATALDIPDDEMQLIFEANPTLAEIAAQSLTVTDTTLNELKGGALYTNQSQQSILQTNDKPPFCKDITVYKDHTFYANTRTQHRYELALIAIGGVTGLNVGDTITIDGTTYTGAVVENVVNDEFLVDTTGTPSQNIDTTALSLLKVINTSATNTTVYGYYLSGFEDIPGKMLIEERGIGGSSFALTSTNTDTWSPKLPSAGTAQSSDNEDRPNRIYISKKQQPEAVPLTNFIEIGSANDPINRIIPLRDSVMVFKDDGIFRITGQGLPFSSYPFNDSIELRGLETAVVLDNRIFLLSDQGVCAVGDSGIEIISRSIEKDLIKLISEQFVNFSKVSFGLSYESERLYILSTVTEPTDTTPTQMFIYNTITNSWTRWPIAYTAGIVKELDDKIYLAHPTDGNVYQERKSRDKTDYADAEYALNVTAAVVNSTTVFLDDTTNIVENSLIRQGTIDVVVDKVISGTEVLLLKTVSLNAAPVLVFTPIAAKVQWIPEYADNPGVIKHFQESTFLFDDTSFSEIDVLFSTNYAVESTFPLERLEVQSGLQWGIPQWGTANWGGSEATFVGAGVIRTLVPVQAARGHWLNIGLSLNTTFSTFSLIGVSIMYQTVSPRIR